MVHVVLTLGPKGQVVIPKEYRKKYHLVSGGKVVLDEEDEKLFIKPARPYGFLELIKSLPKIDLGKLDPHDAYESQMRHREKRRRRASRGG